ncbi:hypothetical protein SAMN05216249_10435 [Acetitomaculum ruminis DSM 5522]|uniref:Ribbon-helix-helix protein, copG family n=1 Tax=Acetitomaculum ruminis DSM 5522 TaxID=1120918 RepID=A0A1I0WGK4_9FIRM|nr:hypothetical protein [Acetitomaculum ruminis]SFA87103.1 hypothetical protein SAMN05216249_10435 [Acetitomaculum ruminis DSM 5522]
MPYTESQKKATLKYQKKTYKRVPLDLRYEDYERLKEHCEKLGKPVNTLIKELIFKELENN